MKKSVLIVGSGNIAKKHRKSLKLISKKIKVKNITSRNFKAFLKTNKNKLKFNFIIVCSPSSDHYRHISLIENSFKKIKVLVEKPLFNKFIKIKKKLKNYYFIGYNLRFHPIIIFLKRFLSQKKILSINVICTSYLPHWRKGKDYRKSVSAQKKFGGGVALELSHEIDYLAWVFKDFKILNSYNKKISNLKINVDDVMNLIAEKNNNTLINLNINFFSRINRRKILVDGDDFSLDADLIKNKIQICEKEKTRTITYKKFNIIDSYKYQNNAILKDKLKNLCKIEQGLKVLEIIYKIKNTNL